jgi:hypothetical protein
MILSLEKIVNYGSIIFFLGKAHGTINGRKICRVMVGCSLRHCSEGYWEGLQKV